MALVNDAKKEIHAKIVYYGPGRAGKTTNLEFIYNKLKPEYRGKFKFLNTPSGRMVFFDFMRPELAGIKDFSLHFHIYTVPGEVIDEGLWKNVLKGVDGVVFVADMDPSRMLENRRSLEDLKGYLAAQNTKLEDIPCIFQLNKKDLSGAMTPEDMKNLLDTGDILLMPAAARAAQGVLPTLSEMVKMILQKLRDTPPEEGEQPSEVAAAEPLSYAEAEPEQPASPVAATFGTFADETVDREPAVEDEQRLMADDLTRKEILAEEPAVTCVLSDISEYELSPTDDDPSRDAVCETLTEIVGERYEEPEPESWAETFAPSVADTEITAEEPRPQIALDGELESVGEGCYRLPIVIRYADKESRTFLTLSLGFE